MLGRRTKATLLNRIRPLVWPRRGWRQGWRRGPRYVLHRLGRMKASPYSLAAGFACGAFASFLPFIGLHFLVAALLAWVIRASVVASAIGTVVGNPWTFPLIWISTYRFGRWLGAEGAGSAESINFSFALTHALRALLDGNVPMLVHNAWPVIKPMLVGGSVLGLICGLSVYFLLAPVIRRAQSHRLQRLLRKRRAGEPVQQEIDL